MTTYISILRGINVSGQKSIRMKSLQEMYENLGFQEVKTYVQSGNVVFKSNDLSAGELEKRIFHQIKNEYGFDVPVLVLSMDQLKKIIDHNPLSKDPGKDPAYLHVTFLAAKPVHVNAEHIDQKKSEKEEMVITEDAVYLYCPNGYGKTKLSNGFLESRLGVTATTRNWKTTNQLLRIAQEISD
jgi:uncharacterized protein (DUF1697 family)